MTHIHGSLHIKSHIQTQGTQHLEIKLFAFTSEMPTGMMWRFFLIFTLFLGVVISKAPINFS